jgi:hypothetical protein
MSARPTAPPRPLRPAFGDRAARNEDPTDRDLHLPRYVFSPFKRITDGLEQTGLEVIEPGVITLVKDFKFPIRNPRKIETPDSDEPEMTRFTRAAGRILDGLLRNHGRDGDLPTGFCELTELRGLDPDASPQDAALLIDLQELLLPQAFETGEAMIEFLFSREKAAKQKGKVYADTLKRMAEAAATSVEFNRVQAAELRDQMAQRAAGQNGYRNKLYAPDEAIFGWIGEEAPTIQTPFSKKAEGAAVVTPPAPQPPAPAIPQDQCDNCGASYNLIVRAGQAPRRPRMCGVCGESLEQPQESAKSETDAPASPKGGQPRKQS